MDIKDSKTLEFIEKSRKKFGNKFDYSEVTYSNQMTKVFLTCNEHGNRFDTTPKVHLSSKCVTGGCSTCARELILEKAKNRPSKLKRSTEDFIEKSKSIHKDENGNPLFDYTCTVYKGTAKRVKLFCLSCQKIIEPWAGDHLNKGTGCKTCSAKTRKNRETDRTLDVLLEQASKIHPDSYFIYCNDKDLYPYKSELKYKCIKHLYEEPIVTKVGEHLRPDKPCGCKYCYTASRRKYDEESFYKLLEDTSKHFNYKYNYSHFKYEDYVNNKMSVDLYCPVHKKTWPASFTNHFEKHTGCPSCGFTLTEEEVKANLVGKQKPHISLDTIKLNYENNSVFVKHLMIESLYCTEHDVYYNQRYRQVLEGANGCPCCSISTSEPELNLGDWVKNTFNLEIIRTFKPEWLVFLDSPFPKELDIYIPDLKLAIEYNGTRFHHSSDDPSLYGREVDSLYHQYKYNLCKENGVSLIHIFEFENLNKWKRKLSNYIRSPHSYDIVFKNNKRTIQEYVLYGQSYIRVRV